MLTVTRSNVSNRYILGNAAQDIRKVRSVCFAYSYGDKPDDAVMMDRVPS